MSASGPCWGLEAYREVTMLEVKEVLLLWLSGAANKRIAAQFGLNVKTVRRYGGAARASGVGQEAGAEAPDHGADRSRPQPGLAAPGPVPGRRLGRLCGPARRHERFLHQGVRLSKLRKLLRR